VVEKKGLLTLYFNSQPWFEKPPLSIWLIAAAYKLFGVNEFSVRIWSAFFGFGCVILVYFFAKQLFLSRRIAFFSSLTLIGFTQFVKQSKMGMMDGPLTFFILLGLFLFWIGRKKDSYLLYVGITTGAAFMIKSFAAFLLPIILIVFAFAIGERQQLVNRKLLLGFLIGFLICLPWHLFEYMKWGRAFVTDYFVHHIFRRTFEDLQASKENPFYYFKMLLSQNIPLGAISYFAVSYIFYSVHLEKDRERRAALILIAAAVAVTFLLYSFVKTKVVAYIIPVYPLLALAIAVTADRLVDNKGRSDTRKLISCLLIVLVMIPVGRFVVDGHRTLDYAPRLKTLSLAAKINSSKHEVLLLYQIPEFWEILFYSGRRINQVNRDELLERSYDANSFLALMSKKDGFFKELNKYGLTVVYEDEEYILYRRL
jgi:4-amino-4-deoxy-L-arabinose transferase-like glycosyltransferase